MTDVKNNRLEPIEQSYDTLFLRSYFGKLRLKLIKNKDEFRSGFTVEFTLNKFGGNWYEYY